MTTNAQENTTPAIPNTGFTRESLDKQMEKFGLDIGRGLNARPAMFMACAEAATKINVGPDDASDLYTKAQKKIAASKGIEYVAEGSQKQQVSKLRVALKLGNLPKIDPMQVLYDTTDVIATCEALGSENPLKQSAYDTLVSVGRKQLEQPEVQLTKEQINSFITDPGAETTMLDRVTQQYKALGNLSKKLAESGIDTTHIDAAREDVASQILSMDGELPPMTKEEAREREARKLLQAQGYELIKKAPDANVIPLAALQTEAAE